MNNFEIERKFLMNELPKELKNLGNYEVEQGYLDIKPRIRKKIDKDTLECSYAMTIKGSGDLIRPEVELEITENQYEVLKNIIDASLITKEYSKYELDNNKILEYSVVDKNKDTSFIYGEVEFKNLEESKEFNVPNYFGEEITYDKNYKMENYWIKTRNVSKE